MFTLTQQCKQQTLILFTCCKHDKQYFHIKSEKWVENPEFTLKLSQFLNTFCTELIVCGSVIKCFFVLLIYLKQPKMKKKNHKGPCRPSLLCAEIKSPLVR